MTRSELMSRIRSVSAMERSAGAFVRRRTGMPLMHQPAGIYGRPDYANKRRKVAVFVHGCFFHKCGRHGSIPKTNTAFWRAKFERNAARHKSVSRRLRSCGWRVVTVWEHSVRRR